MNQDSLDKKTKYILDQIHLDYDSFPEMDLDIGGKRYHNKKVISIEGVNGVGKTSQVELIKKKLPDQLICIVPSRVNLEASKEAYESVKADSYINPVKQTLLFLASETYKEFQISKICGNSNYVLYDRYIDSLFLIQRYELLKEYDNIQKINKWLNCISKFLPAPDLTFVLDAKPSICIDRLKKREDSGREIQKQQIEEIVNLRNDFRYLAKRSERNIILIDASKNLEEVCNQILIKIRHFIDN